MQPLRLSYFEFPRIHCGGEGGTTENLYEGDSELFVTYSRHILSDFRFRENTLMILLVSGPILDGNASVNFAPNASITSIGSRWFRPASQPL